MRLAEVLAEEDSAIERGVMLAWNVHPLLHPEAIGDRLERSETPGVLGRVVAVMSQIAGEEDELGLWIEGIDSVDGALESLRAEGIGRPLKSNVRVAELHDREGPGGFAVTAAEEVAQGHTAGGRPEGHELQKGAGADRGCGNTHE